MGGFLLRLLRFLISLSVLQVGSHEVAVVQGFINGDPSNHSLWSQPLGPGTHFIIPFVDRPTIYSTQNFQYTMAGPDAIPVQTRDKHVVSVDLTVIYRVDVSRANLVFANWGTNYEARFIRPTVREIVNDAFAQFTEAEFGRNLGTLREAVENQIQQTLASVFYKNGFILQNALIRNITFTKEFIATITIEEIAQATAKAIAGKK